MRGLVVGVLLATASCGREPAAVRAKTVENDPDRYVSAEGRYSVVFPGPPDVTERNVETEIGTFTIHEAGLVSSSSVSGELAAFTVSYSDLPPGGKLRMVETMRALVRKPPRVLVSETELEVVPSVRGLELVYEEDGFEKTARVFELGGRYYQLLVAYPKGKRPPGFQRFFASFTLY